MKFFGENHVGIFLHEGIFFRKQPRDELCNFFGSQNIAIFKKVSSVLTKQAKTAKNRARVLMFRGPKLC